MAVAPRGVGVAPIVLGRFALSYIPRIFSGTKEGLVNVILGIRLQKQISEPIQRYP